MATRPLTKAGTYSFSFADVCSTKADEHFASQIILLPGTLYIPTHFAFLHILLPDTIDSSAHFAPQHILITVTLCSLENLTHWNTLLPGTHYFKCSMGAKNVEEDNLQSG